MKRQYPNGLLLDNQRAHIVSLCVWGMLLTAILVCMTRPVTAQDAVWEYKVVILQGVTAGGTIKKDASGVYVDTKRTQVLNTLAAEGWEVVAAMGSLGTDHTVYLRRRLRM